MLVRAQYVNVVGIDFSTNTTVGSGSHAIQITSGCAGNPQPADYFTEARRGHHIQVLNCRFHDWQPPGHYGCVKVNQVDYINLQGCEMYNNPPNPNDPTYPNQQPCCIDFGWVSYSNIRQWYFHDFYGSAIYTKGGSQYDVSEQNVIVNCVPTYYSAGIQTSDGTDLPFCNPNTPWETEYYVVRNNIIKSVNRAGVLEGNAHGLYIYNNLFVDCGDATQTQYHCWRADICQHDLTGASVHLNGKSQTVRIFNNIFLSTTGAMSQSTGDFPYHLDGGAATDWSTGYNNYYNNGGTIPAGDLKVDGQLLNPNTEPGATFGNPSLTLTGTPTTWQGWVDYYRPQWDAQSNAALKDMGDASAVANPLPAVLNDIEGNPRPRDNGWDIGPYEYQGVVCPPLTGFVSDTSWGTSPCAVQFTDTSAGGPTSWAWSFGDGGTDTVQNPSHTYAAFGLYTVALTASNEGGSNTCEKANFITIKALQAGFTSSPPGGGVPLTVTFTDTSTNSPTSWCWDFGDTGAGTAQNPLHTYSVPGFYTVTLTAANASGSDTYTQANCVTACTQVDVFPTSWSSDYTASPNNEQLVSGDLSSLQAADGNPMIVSCNTTQLSGCTAPNGQYAYSMYFYGASGYTASQVYGFKMEYMAKADVDGVGCHRVFLNDFESTGCPPNLTTSYATQSATRLGNASSYLDRNGTLSIHICGKKNTSSAYNVLTDYMVWHLYLMPVVNVPPVANFSGAPTAGPAPLTVTFTDSSANTPTAWSWDFGDSNTSTAQNPSHTYASNGSYTVALTASNTYGSNTRTKNAYIAVGDPPVADFSAAPTSGTDPLTVSFTDASVNSPTAWSWNFGDSATSSLQNPSHTYGAGSFTVALTATNAYGANTATKTGYIAVAVSPPVASFSGTPTVGTFPLTVNFTDASTHTPTSWTWSFGDGGVATVKNPSHVYTAAGSYAVSLTAANSGGSDLCSKGNYITVSQPIPAANFSATPTAGAPPLSVAFTDASTNGPTAWSWDFGDGGTDTVQSPSHTYTSAGTYTVTLTAANSGGSNTNTKANYITASNPPVANFSGTPTSGTAPLSVTFTDSSTNSPTAWSWAFGDGKTSTAQNPSHTYTTAGTYSVTLTATNVGGGSLPCTQTGYIVVAGGLQTPICQINCGTTTPVPPYVGDEYYSAGSTSGTGTTISTSGVSNPAPMAVYQTARWGNLTYTVPGLTPNASYTVRLHFAESYWAQAGQRKFNVSINGTQVLSNFDILATAGGANIALAQQFAATADGSGRIAIVLTSVVDNAEVSGIEVLTDGGSAPVANFTGSPTSGAAPLAVMFTDSSAYTPTAWSWTFGDSNTSTVQNPSHTYAAAGQYTVVLTATNSHGSATCTKSNYIVVGNPAPVANFSGAPTSGLYPLAVTFTDSSTNIPTAWSWTFGDSTTSTVQNPSHTYTAAGSFTVALTATNQYGSNTKTQTNYITVGTPAPAANFSGAPTTGPAPLAVTFTDSSTNTPTAWSWSFGDSAASTVKNPSHTYTALGGYTVALTATNAGGSNTCTKSGYIYVSNIPVANFSGTPTSGNIPLTVTFTDSSTNTPTAWSWTFGDATTSTVQNASHTYTSVGTFTVALTATNGDGSNTCTKSNYITATNSPVASFTATPTSGVVPLAVTFTDTSTNSPTAWSWSFGDRTTSTVRNPSHSYGTVGPFTVSLTATNAGGSNTMTQVNDINVSGVGQTVVYASAINSGSHGYTYVSGTLPTSVNSQDGNCYVIAFPASGNGYIAFNLATTGITPAQVSRVTFQFVVRSSLSTTPNALMDTWTSNGNQGVNSGGGVLVGSSDHWYTIDITSGASNYLWADKHLQIAACCCHNNSSAYTLSFDLVKATLYIPPIANFSGTPTSGSTPLTVAFTDTSTNSPTAWSWTFGDGGTSTAQNPSHTYNAAGTYNVALIASNAGGSSTSTKAGYITATLAAPVASFSGAPTSGAYPLTVSFVDSSTNTPTAWSWNFGDSGTSTVQNPTHSYAAAGVYAVSLTATNAAGSNTCMKAAYIAVNPPAPVANFTATPNLGTVPLTVSFTDTSTNSPTSWSWDFGDASGSTVENPSHTYSAAGSYTVALTSTNVTGTNTCMKSNYLTAGNPPAADFSGTPTSGAIPLAVNFTDASTNSPTAWSWTFGDGESSNLPSPSHTYTAVGTYTVALTATNNFGGTTCTKTALITTAVAPVAGFSGAPTTGNSPLLVSFTDSSTNTPTSWTWNFGDGGVLNEQNPSHRYEATGKYRVSLTASNIAGSDTITKTDYVAVNPPVASFSGTPTLGALPLTVSFTEASTNQPTNWNWNFGDGGTSNEQNPSHVYTAVGTFGVTLTVTNAGGADTCTQADYITAGNPPAAEFSGTPTSGAIPLAVTFADNSTNDPTSWAWTFGDGETSDVQSPNHTYSAVGTYAVALTATNKFGSTTCTKGGFITTAVAPVAGFTGTPTAGNSPLVVSFTDSSTNTPTSWAWAFGDGSVSNEQNPSHTYNATGKYRVSLSVANVAGSDTMTKSDCGCGERARGRVLGGADRGSVPVGGELHRHLD